MEFIQLQYHSELLNFIDIPVLDLYVNTCPNLIPAVFNSGNCVVPWQTKTAEASRDPSDPPDDPRDYTPRVRHTARAGNTRKSLKFLLPSELEFSGYLAHMHARAPLN